MALSWEKIGKKIDKGRKNFLKCTGPMQETLRKFFFSLS